MPLFEVKPVDHRVYEEELRDFLPPEMIDIHTHVWRESLLAKRPLAPNEVRRTVSWPDLVAKENPVEDLQEMYRLMFPGKRVTPMMFSTCAKRESHAACNEYVRACAEATGYPALFYSRPEMPVEALERALVDGGFLGVKSYLDLAPEYLPEAEIRIFDFFPPEQLRLLDEMGLIVMLHIPRPARLRDAVNIAQIREIKRSFPRVKLIVAHIGRAYCERDVGDAFEALAACKDLLFDFSANTSEFAMTKLLEAVGPRRVLFGSDAPILRMRMRRIEENGTYVNLVPPGLYGDVSKDAHMREVPPEEGEGLTFFMYEEIRAFRRAALRVGLRNEDVSRAFYGNAKEVIDSARANLQAWR